MQSKINSDGLIDAIVQASINNEPVVISKLAEQFGGSPSTVKKYIEDAREAGLNVITSTRWRSRKARTERFQELIAQAKASQSSQ